jgi:hypothetical protein
MPAVPLLVLLLVQSPAVPVGDAAQLDRIRDALAQAPAIAMPAQADDSGKMVFRVKIQMWTLKGHPWDQDATSVPAYVRPRMPLAHYEFLKMVTPEAFRASTLYGPVVGVGFDPVIVKNAFNAARRALAERSARDEVRRALEAYLQARASGPR